MAKKIRRLAKSPKRPRIPWHELRTLYTTNPDLSLRELADTYSVNASTVKRKARAENWKGQREQTVRRMQEEARRYAARRLAKLATENAVEALENFATLRREAVSMIAAELQGEKVVEETTEVLSKSTGGDERDYSSTTKKKAPSRPDSKFLQTVLTNERHLIASVLQLDRIVAEPGESRAQDIGRAIRSMLEQGASTIGAES